MSKPSTSEKRSLLITLCAVAVAIVGGLAVFIAPALIVTYLQPMIAGSSIPLVPVQIASLLLGAWFCVQWYGAIMSWDMRRETGV